ncbi:MAG: RlmE family RNA methyltransferase [Betaproteobacteria bacterium]|nr:RlmE family RNA methyltransferase [Betaproteobacteria bacterium]
MARSKSSNAWLQRHVKDAYVRRAREDGLRSRAAYKLQEIDARERILRRGARVVDLGGAPGGWSQVAASKVGKSGRVVAVDLLEIAPISGVTVLRGDFRDLAVRDAVRAALEGAADVVLSDLSPKLCGIASVDQANAARLVGLAIEFGSEVLKSDGVFLVKVFQGEAFGEVLAQLREAFASVATRKPKASREESRETYLLARAPHHGD